MASSCSCIACGESKEEAETFCNFCKAAFNEIATEADSLSATCEDSPEIEIATAEKEILGSKRKLCPAESCAVCGQHLGATPDTPYCSVCASAMTEIASPEAATNSVPSPICDSTRRRLQFDAASGCVTVDLTSPKKLAALLTRNQKESMPDLETADLETDDENPTEQSQESSPGSVCETDDEYRIEQSQESSSGSVCETDDENLTKQSQESSPGSVCETDDENLKEQSQESSPGSICEVTEVLTVEDVIGQRFIEATQNGEIVDLLSQEDEFESSEVIGQRFLEATQNGEVVNLLSLEDEFESSEVQ
jgi:hypothetical protein